MSLSTLQASGASDEASQTSEGEPWSHQPRAHPHGLKVSWAFPPNQAITQAHLSTSVQFVTVSTFVSYYLLSLVFFCSTEYLAALVFFFFFKDLLPFY